jgi:uncharacterized protein YbcC (UPF0753/DUF2309 family)
MLRIASPLATEYVMASVLDDALEVCRRIPPLWDLENYVAVNPFLGFAGQPIAEAARTISDGLGGRVLPGIAYYRERWRAGAFGRAELERAAGRVGHDPATLMAILDGRAPIPTRPPASVLTYAERYDQQHGTRWNEHLVRHTADWCAAHLAPDTAAAWGRTPDAAGLYAAWREAAIADRSLELRGMAGWRPWAARLPTQPLAAIETLADELRLHSAERPAYFYRLLGGVFGWASFLRRAVWVAGDCEIGPLLDLLAMRVCTDAAAARLLPWAGDRPQAVVLPDVEDETVRLIFQEALEDGYARRLLGGLRPPPAGTAPRPAVQAVFCIDVRSEVLRRHLEALSPAIETRGFAGFFGVFLDWETAAGHSARCPVLLQPGLQVRSQAPAPLWQGGSALKRATTAPAAAYTFVETLGLGYALGLAGDALARLVAPRDDEGSAPFTLEPGHGSGVALESRVELAALILKNMGLRERYGRIVLLAGHEGCSENNPHQAGLDCGACGGHGGAINARIAAALLNDPQVRAALPACGYLVPADTYVLPAVHNTSDDTVRLLDRDRVPATHLADMAQLEAWLAEAGARTRAERAAGLGVAAAPRLRLARLLRRRARDWSEVRPEWALARNAAFIAARRDRTRGVDLAGRAFLHEYDWTTDPDNSILTLVLTAPMVVASWINLQYFASTVDNDMFGCGTKALHNRVGTLGVVLGNGGDLRTGLALQSVQGPDGAWYHEPLRLQVVVEAPTDRIEAVLAAQPGVRDLVENGWVRLFALSPDSAAVARWRPGAGWEWETDAALAPREAAG